MGNKDKTRDGDATADRDHRDSCANRDHSQNWEASRDAMLTKTIAEAVAGCQLKPFKPFFLTIKPFKPF